MNNKLIEKEKKYECATNGGKTEVTGTCKCLYICSTPSGEQRKRHDYNITFCDASLKTFLGKI